jgi:CBS domain-containing protein
MSRTDMHLDAILRHLGAVYYESRHGEASRADVDRALGTVEEHVQEQPRPSQLGTTAPPGLPRPRSRREARCVKAVMTTAVVTVDRLTPYKEIARLLSENRVSGLPVLFAERHVTGVVTEANLLADEEKRACERVAIPGHGPQQQWALTAEELMSSPAITISPNATIAGAARGMTARNVRRLPVVDSGGRLLGIVSRRDLLSVFLRPDNDVAADVREIFDEMLLPVGPETVTVTVKDGIVILTGPPGTDRNRIMVAVAIRLAWGVDGVVDIIDRRDVSDRDTKPAAAHSASATPQSS